MTSRKAARKLPKTRKLKRTRRTRRFRKTRKIKGGFKWPWQWFRAAPQSDPLQSQAYPLQSYAPLFGMEIEKNKRLFNNYVLYEEGRGIDVRKKWGPLESKSKSRNGNVGLVTFNAQNVVVPAVIKQSKDAESDNLMYEYRVGRFLNKYCSILPSFTYTYGIYTHLTLPTVVGEMPYFTKSEIALRDYSIQEACSKTDGMEKLCLLIQYFQAKSFSEFIKINKNKIEDQRPFIHDMRCILFQIYYSLRALNGKFLHNDLSESNVLVKELSSKVKFKFTWEGKIIEFKTRYLAKIIDYGRSNYYEDETHNSEKDMEATCDPSSGCTVEETKSPFGNVTKLCGNQEGFEMIQYNVLEAKRNLLKQDGDYIYDSTLASNAFFEESVFNELFVTPPSEYNTKKIKLVDESYNTFLNALAALLTAEESKLGRNAPSGYEYAELVVNGIDPMVFKPSKTPIDSPYIPPDGWRRNWLPSWFTRREPRRNKFQTQRVAPVAEKPPPAKISPHEKFQNLQKYPPLFGMEISSFMEKFDSFVLYYSPHPVQKSWKPLSFGANGYTYLVSFSLYGFSVPALLKRANYSQSDNLMYEYKVGSFINKYCSKLPSFVYTYGIYTHLDLPKAHTYKEIEPNKYKQIPLANQRIPNFKKDEITVSDYSMSTACDLDNGTNHLCLLTQFVHKSFPLSKLIIDLVNMSLEQTSTEQNEQIELLTYDLRCIMYQIYYTLHKLFGQFEHNDLHANNVLIKKLDVCIDFQFPNCRFKSSYLAKIIDYGRSGYQDIVENSENDMAEVCKSCPTTTDEYLKMDFCGAEEGFKGISRNVLPGRRNKDYRPDSRLIIDISYYEFDLLVRRGDIKRDSFQLFKPKVPILPNDVAATLFDATEKLIDPSYATLLLQLKKLIEINPTLEKECAHLVIDGNNDMIFNPHETISIDQPYKPDNVMPKEWPID